MRISPKILTVCLSLAAVLIGCSPFAESQTFRERMLERRAAGADVTRASVPAGLEQARITVNGQSREFLYHVPANRPAAPGVVLALHGGRGSGAKFAGQIPSLLSLSDREGFVAVYPSADGQWNDGRAAFAGQPEDIDFLRAVIDWTATNLNADRGRVFSTGASNGGGMSYKLACDTPGLVAGIAPIIASFTASLYEACAPAAPTPVAIFNGTDDPLMVYEGGKSTSPLTRFVPNEGDSIVATETTAEFWARVNGCSTSPSVRQLPDTADDGTSVTLLRYCDRVLLYRINGGGHSIPGVSGRGPRGRAARRQDLAGHRRGRPGGGLLQDLRPVATPQAGAAARNGGIISMISPESSIIRIIECPYSSRV